MILKIPKLSLVVLVGASGSGKSTFARKHFLPTEILSSDACRAIVSDHENDQSVTKVAFEVLHFIAAKRLALGRLVVIDATNVQPEARKSLVELARQYHCLPVAIVLNLPRRVCEDRNRDRADRDFPHHVIEQQCSQLRRSIRGLGREGFRNVYILESAEDADTATLERVPLWNDRRDDAGPFDIIGDVHGCCDELEELLTLLGYEKTLLDADEPLWGRVTYVHPQRRKVVFVGDLVDRGPRILNTLRIVRNMCVAGSALSVPGNHDVKLLRKLRGKDVPATYGLADTLAEISALRDDVRKPFCEQLAAFIDSLVSHYVFHDGRLVVAHAGLREEMHGRGSGKVREFALYGETTGETDEFGLPIRFNWAAEYRGAAMVVYGHTPVPEPIWLNRTINIDTGCVFGGRLTALRYPEKELVSVPARKTYCESARPFLPVAIDTSRSLQQQHDDILDAEDVLGKRIIQTRLRGNITVREENAAAALEIMSRFAADPKWLIYLPPTMSPSETTTIPGLLEHPADAFSYYRSQGCTHVICEEKHMGSRAIVVLCKDADAARTRFGITTDEYGIVYTRTGRKFFNDDKLEQEFLNRIRTALSAASFWEKFQTSWVCLDCELMPWSAKAQELLRGQYAAVGSAGSASLPRTVQALQRAGARLTGEAAEIALRAAERFHDRDRNIHRFINAYRHYCWPVQSVDDLKLAPFHILASEGHVYTDQPHAWHLQTLADICAKDPRLLLATEHRLVDLGDPDSEASAVAWWTEHTSRGGEGMVVKPLEFIHNSRKGLSQPAVKCRGPEYLRIIYGPDYDTRENLDRLRSRGLGHKRSLALREFALGLEALHRFVEREPLRRVHECTFAVLALESEPVDPRL